VNYHGEDVHNEVFSNMVNYHTEDTFNEVFSNVEDEKEEGKSVDMQKVSDTVSSVGSAAASIAATAQAFQNQSKKEQKQAIRSKCGMKPHPHLQRKKRKVYDECVASFKKEMSGSTQYTPSSVPSGRRESEVPVTQAGFEFKTWHGLAILGVLAVGGYFVYRAVKK